VTLDIVSVAENLEWHMTWRCIRKKPSCYSAFMTPKLVNPFHSKVQSRSAFFLKSNWCINDPEVLFNLRQTRNFTNGHCFQVQSGCWFL